MAHPGGRPTKYKPEYCEQIIDYFQRPPVTVLYKEEYHKDGELKCKVPVSFPTDFPTFQGFANSIEVNQDTLHEWKNTHPKFSESYARAKEIQEHIWLTNGMNNLYNSQFAQFFGKNCLGYKDKNETEISGPGGGPIQTQNLSDEELDAKILEILEGKNIT